MHKLQELDLVEFIAFLAIAEMAGASIHLYVSGVKHHLKIQSLPDFSTNFTLALVLKGISNTDNRSGVRIPITLGMLDHMCLFLQHVVASSYLVMLYTALFIVAFHGLFCPGELMQSMHAVTIDQVHFQLNRAQFFLKSSKCHKASLPLQVLTILAQDQLVICPVSALRTFLSFQPNVAGQLFIKVDSTLIYALDLNRVLQKLCSFLQLPTNYIKPHSLLHRRCKLSAFFGCSPATIQSRGKCSSAYFKCYIHP